jgi:hypothetical protein
MIFSVRTAAAPSHVQTKQGLALFAPRMKMIADVDGIEARLFRRHRVFEQLARRVLLRARFPTEFDGHDLLLARS